MASGKAEKVDRGENDYRLQVAVIEARKLASKDSNGLSDPYCIVTFGKVKHKTKVVKANLNPRWEEEFLFNDVKTPVTLNVQLWDYDKFRKDDFLGQFDLVVEKAGELDQWIPLEGRGKDEVISGEVHLKVHLESYAELHRRYSVPKLP